MPSQILHYFSWRCNRAFTRQKRKATLLGICTQVALFSFLLTIAWLPIVSWANSETKDGEVTSARKLPSMAGEHLLKQRRDDFLRNIHDATLSGPASGQLTSLARFDWQSACVVGPYGLGVHETLTGERLTTTSDLRWLHDAIPWIGDERYWTLLLISTTTLTSIQINRSEFQYIVKDAGECISGRTAMYKITRITGRRALSVFEGRRETKNKGAEK